MAKVKEELSADVRFGGTIDPSWTKSVTGLERGLQALGKESSDLIKQQSKLKTKRLEAAMRGDVEQVKKLNAEHAALARKIKETTDQEDRLTRAYKRREQMDRFKGRAGSVAKGVGRGALWAGAGVAGGITGLMAAAAAMSSEMTDQAALAKTYSMDPLNFLAANNLARKGGLNNENVGDLHEEYKNKLGEYREAGMTKGALYEVATDLGLKKGELKGMNNEEQVSYFLDRLATMGDGQMAASMADKLFGGEGNKLITLLRSMGMTYSEAIAKEKERVMVSHKGIAEAEKGQNAMSSLWGVVKTAAMEISGITIGALSEKIEAMTTAIAGWFKGGGLDKITTFITDSVLPAGAALARGLFLVAKVAYEFAKKLSWILPDEEGDRKGILKVMAGMGAAPAKAMAKRTGQEEWLNQTLKDNPNLERDLREKREAGGGLFAPREAQEAYERQIDSLSKKGSFDEKVESISSSLKQGLGTEGGTPAPAFNPKDLTDASKIEGGKRVNNDVKTTINVYQQPGEDSNALAERTAKEIMRPFQSGMYDPAEVM